MSDGTSDRDLRGSDCPGVLGRWPAAAEPASAPGVTIEPADWPDKDQPLIGYVAGGTIFPPLAGPLGQLAVTQDANGETIHQVVDFDRAVRDDRLPSRHAEYRDRTLAMGPELYADFVANFVSATLGPPLDGVTL